MKQKWILVTAGLGSDNIQCAAERVASDASHLDVFSQIIVLRNDNIGKLCPTVTSVYSPILNSKTRGYGYMSWKAEIVYRTLLENPENCVVVWIDAGCEVSPSAFTRLKFMKLLNTASSDGYLFFELNTKENQYTKRELYDEFPSLDISDTKPQAQTTFFALAGSTGIKIAARWFEIVVKSEIYINEELKSKQAPNFIEHRHDQSIFSLVLKELGYQANLSPLRNGQNGKFFRYLTFILDPVIAARNRYGVSIAPACIRRVGIFSLRIFKSPLDWNS